jgi:predicted enzyme related to lactoylglutathione lyase
MDDKLMKHGAFSWFELMTGDVEGAKAFYQKVFNWKTKDEPMEGFTYTTVNVNGDDVAGIMGMPPDSGEMPPAWGIYFTVDDINETVKIARESGGTILVEPREIPNVGTFSVIQDPQGAWFSVMQYAES